MTILPLPVRPLHQLPRHHHQSLHFHRIQKITIAMKNGCTPESPLCCGDGSC
ncbi:hypothetical protein NA56DRAFT_640840 [Hyaloscypha hepaticicola]|uniref:Uncharacterized protein n=1 Tax=Hyaloscypha hepaticicola TaxID=2082293 RepID=A0A2J6QLE1_9HELO|nr:hypothetical protein NA56DRAFT_640840 [Hyaloscypha hepaticicola]